MAKPDLAFLSELSSRDFEAVYFLVTGFEPTSRTSWLDGLRRIRRTADEKEKPRTLPEITALANSLRTHGLMLPEPSFALSPESVMRIYELALERGLVAKFAEADSRGYSYGRYTNWFTLDSYRFSSSRALFLDDLFGQSTDHRETIERSLSRGGRDAEAFLANVFGEQPEARFIARLSPAIRAMCRRFAIARATRELRLDSPWFAADEEGEPDEQIALAELDALRGRHERALARLQNQRGKEAALVRTLNSVLSLDRHDAREQVGKCVSASQKNLPRDATGLRGIALVLAYAMSDTATDRDEALRLANMGTLADDSATTGYDGLRLFLRGDIGSPPNVTTMNRAIPTHDATWEAMLGLGLALSLGQVTGASPAVVARFSTLGERCRVAGFEPLAREFEHVARRLAGKPDAANEPSIATSIAVRAPWESVLDALEAGLLAVDEESKGRVTRSKTRRVLGYTVIADSGTPFISPVSFPEGTTSFRDESIVNLQRSTNEMVTPQDRIVLAAATAMTRARASGGLKLDHTALPLLVDHPHLFSRAGRPINVRRIEPKLHFEEQQKGLVVRFFPSRVIGNIAFNVDSEGNIACVELDAKSRKLLDAATVEGRVLPADAKPRLFRILSRSSGRAAVEGALLEGAATEVPADARLRVQLFRRGAVLRARLRVSPLGAEGPSLPPGVGADVVFAEREGKPIRARRDRAAERREAEALLAQMPMFSSLERDGDELLATDPQEQLELLAELAQHAASLVVEWKEGEAQKLPVLVRASQVKLQVGGGISGWLELNGEIHVDEGAVISMRDLLDRKAAMRGRFVELADGRLLALAEDAQRRIDALLKITEIKKKKFVVHPFVANALGEWFGESVSFEGSARAFSERIEAAESATHRMPRGLDAELRDYQTEGFRFLASRAAMGAGAVLADDMGLGKTVQTIALLLARSSQGPALVVAPTSVVPGWIEQLSRFAPRLRSIELVGKDRQKKLAEAGKHDVLLVSYGLLSSLSESLAKTRFATIIFDEAHALKNASTQRAKAAFELDADFRVALSGTPIENHLGELWSILRAVLPGLLGSESEFQSRFVGPIASGDRNALAVLRSVIRPFVLRRRKSDVLSELPSRTELIHHVAPSDSERAFYEALRRSVVEKLESLEKSSPGDRLAALAEISRLRMAATDPRLVDPDAPEGSKLEAALDLLEEIRAGGHRALVFGQYLGALAQLRAGLAERGIEALYLDGSTPAKERGPLVERFQNGEGDVFVISLRAGGAGLNLTGADYVVLLDPWWNPAVEDQAADRAHRIGQTRPVTIVRLVTEGTIEERIVAMHGEKRALAGEMLEGMDERTKLDLNALRSLVSE